ncbi:JAB domain-containing protein [Chryseobacterium gossypii]|uniref:JAB domain-containing protein n=1 Tax=Chryseobacterium gossypii TaxID=3231602 RepID=UPI003524A513
MQCNCHYSSTLITHQEFKTLSGRLKNYSEHKKCIRILNIKLLDHCILTSTDYMSFADEGYL